MPTATWNGAVIAEATADVVRIVENNVYFPPEAVRREYLVDSGTHTICGWKGKASYYSLLVDGKTNADAAWYYPDPLPEAREIAGYIAFWHGVDVQR
jgi:uncharacterized protein (DUF427 family)